MPGPSAHHPVVFAYNFPHKKTQDFLQRLMLIGRAPELVLLADRVDLQLPPPARRIKPRHCDLVPPRTICDRFGWRHEVVDHASVRCVELLCELRPAIGVIAGARVLPGAIIDCFARGVINFHPGIIPQVRGLDALQWSLQLNEPLGVTAHLIDRRIDAGRIVERRTIEEFADDTFIDLSLRLAETQVQMLSSALEIVATSNLSELEAVPKGTYRRSFPADLSSTLPEVLARRLARIAKAA